MDRERVSASWSPRGTSMFLCAMPIREEKDRKRPGDEREIPIPTLLIVLLGDDYGGWSALCFEGASGWHRAMSDGARRWLFGEPGPAPSKVTHLTDAIARCEAHVSAWIDAGCRLETAPL